MAELGAKNVTRTTSTVKDYSVDAESLDYAAGKETVVEFKNATINLGYYFNIPELKKAIDALATWTVGKGWKPEDNITKVELEHLQGWGEDTFQSLMWNLIVTKKIVGDAFAEIIRSKDGKLINLKPISPERVRIVVDGKGLIKRYEVRTGHDKFTTVERKSMLHLCNDRVADQIHGTSMIDACKWVIDARNEALQDERMIKHRDLAMGVLEIDTDNAAKRDKIIEQYSDSVNTGEVLVLPKGLAELKPSGNISTKDRLEWIRYLENFFYQAAGVPRIIATSEGFTEAGGQVGFLTFEPIYTQEQALLEADLWNQMGIKVKFVRPPQLGGVVQDNAEKNTGLISPQPNNVEATLEPG